MSGYDDAGCRYDSLLANTSGLPDGTFIFSSSELPGSSSSRAFQHTEEEGNWLTRIMLRRRRNANLWEVAGSGERTPPTSAVGHRCARRGTGLTSGRWT